MKYGFASQFAMLFGKLRDGPCMLLHDLLSARLSLGLALCVRPACVLVPHHAFLPVAAPFLLAPAYWLRLMEVLCCFVCCRCGPREGPATAPLPLAFTMGVLPTCEPMRVPLWCLL